MKNSAQNVCQATLYDPRYEHDNCGIGFVTHINGRASHDILMTALIALGNQVHRGAVSADANTGDGAGVLTQIPRKLFLRELERQGVYAESGDIAVGMLFLPQDAAATEVSCRIIEQTLTDYRIDVLGWRDVPTNDRVLGQHALETKPRIRQVIVGRPAGLSDDDYERTLFLARKKIEEKVKNRNLNVYIPSFSSRTLVYKGLLIGTHLSCFYSDLRDPCYRTALAVYHQRYSTNTFPTWERAQPFRMISHNGEINTLQGNINWVHARQHKLHFPEIPGIPGKENTVITSVLDENGSDSGMLDNALEVLIQGGRDIRHAVAMTIPEAWEKIPDMEQSLREFYQYHGCLMEPWDGPAAITFSDGTIVGTTLDRNGLRPARYSVTEDGLVISGSEAGVVPLEEHRIIKKGRLGPGQMIAVDTRAHRFYENADIKHTLATRQPYGLWLKQHLVRLETLMEQKASTTYHQLLPSKEVVPGDAPAMLAHDGHSKDNGHALPADGNKAIDGKDAPTQHNAPDMSAPDGHDRAAFQMAFGYTSEELNVVMKPMMRDGREPVGAMGDGTPAPPLSQYEIGRPLFNYFKQRFAEVTNPPIDPLREALVMSLSVRIGGRLNILDETPEHAHLLRLASPILTDEQLAVIRAYKDPLLKTATISILAPINRNEEHATGNINMHQAIEQICHEAEQQTHAGASLLILSDKGVDANHAPVPSLLAVGAVHHHLIRVGLRGQVSLLVESGEPREVHHMACLIGYGAKAINPYLAIASIGAMARKQETITKEEAERNYTNALEKGILKIMSKMGISPVESYCGAQIFEAIGLDRSLVDMCFTGTPSCVSGIGFEKLAQDVMARHHRAFGSDAHLPSTRHTVHERDLLHPGFYKFKKGGEPHAYSPEVVRAMHEAVIPAADSTSGEFAGLDSDGNISAQGYARYRVYADLVNTRTPIELRDLMEFVPAGPPVPLEEVEPIEDILPRFSTAAMSHGAMSSEAHETLSIAMNRIGGMGNSGEGGEAIERYTDERNSRIKQVASGRFGVTTTYLVNADELQIKMAQGSKPGEGGHLPGHKVSDEIARIRHTTPGVPLISPPPHHDIYSIEDLAQLIYDLKRVNPDAKVSVKLVSMTGVGTIAAGVAKGYSDIILISGSTGGTGASPLSSIKNAGMPWELGLAETQQTLVLNSLRKRICIRADGAFQTGRDVVIAAMLGADQYSFGTAAMVAEGCRMARVCHNNTCPVGVATQRLDLREKFPGKPEMVMAFFRYMAQEIRELLASLGLRSLNEAIGRANLLRQRKTGIASADLLDLTRMLTPACDPELQERCYGGDRNSPPVDEETIGDRLLFDARDALSGRGAVQLKYGVSNGDRTLGARISGAISKLYGEKGLPPDTIHITLRGSAGQSFGAFNAPGMHLLLLGEANDYVGKCMAGGQIVVRPPEHADLFVWHENVIAGNTILYGSTGGTLYLAGRVGERFAVRNSGATAVVEGVGDHGCEYMTGGTVVILGPTGYNFGAGMTGGVAYVLDEQNKLKERFNAELIQLDRLNSRDESRVKELVRHHMEATGSPRAVDVLLRWEKYRELFWRVLPREMAAKIEAANEGQEEKKPVPIHPTEQDSPAVAV